MSQAVADLDFEFCRLAVDKAKTCPVNQADANPAPRVAIVIAKDGALVGWAAKGVGGECVIEGQTRPFDAKRHQHAEQLLLEALRPIDLAGATAYVTLEPCTRRKKGRSCAELLVEAGLRRIYVANCDPNPDVGALAWRQFHRAGIAVLDFPGDLRNEARRDNDSFFRKFCYSPKEQGEASFDFETGDGRRTLGSLGREFHTRWANRGLGSIHALDCDNNVSVAKDCTEFCQIDDPGRWFEDQNYTKPVHEGEIVIFKSEHGFALVKILKVLSRTPESNAELRFAYELRYT